MSETVSKKSNNVSHAQAKRLVGNAIGAGAAIVKAGAKGIALYFVAKWMWDQVADHGATVVEGLAKTLPKA
jgi:hypothetical protein